MKQKSQKKKNEKCAMCGSSINSEGGQGINKRRHYIAGIGELCDKCYLEHIKEKFEQ